MSGVSLLLVAPLQVAADPLHVRAQPVQRCLFVQEGLLFLLLVERRHVGQVLLVLRADALELLAEARQLSFQVRDRLREETVDLGKWY